MAIDFVEGFDWAGAVADLQLRWGVQDTANVSLITGRQGGSTQAIRFASVATTTRIEKAQGQYSAFDDTHWIFGFAIRINALPTTRSPIFVQTSSRRNDFAQLILDQAGFMHWVADNDTTPFLAVSGITNDRLQLNTWQYIEIEHDVRDGSGTGQVTIRIDGKISLSTVTGTVTIEEDGASSWGILKTFNGMQMDVDDIYFGNLNEGSLNLALLGDTNIETLFPSADGATNAWSFFGGISRWESVDEGLGVSHDGDTTYIHSQTQGQEQLFAMGDLSTDTTNGVVFYVQASYVAKKENSGGRGAVAMIRQNSVERLDGTQIGAGQGGYVMTYVPQEANPDGDIAWTPTTVNAMELGIQTEKDDFFPSLITE